MPLHTPIVFTGDALDLIDETADGSINLVVTSPRDLVLDPFCGAGTTLKVAHELGRRAVGFEIDAAEADKARQWLAEPVQAALLQEVIQ